MYILQLMCVVFVISQVSDAYIDRSVEEKIDIDTETTRYLNYNLPKDFFCCNDNDMLTNEDWIVLCSDKNNVTYNITVECELIHFFRPSSEIGLKFYFKNKYFYVGSLGYEERLIPNRSCFGNETTTGQIHLKVLMCNDKDDLEENMSKKMNQKAKTAGALSLLSAPFTTMVIIIYSTVAELGDVQGQSILSLCISYLISSVMIANDNLQILEVQRGCHAGGDILYFALMANIFWMSAITIQTFMDIRFPMFHVRWSKLTWYSCYGWGLPSFLLIWTMVSDIVPSSLILRSMNLDFKCSSLRYNDKTEWKFYLGPITAAVGLSCILFLYSALLLHRMQSNDLRYKALRYKFFLSLKLFAVVGISWLNEPFQKLHGDSSFIWVIGDCWNLLQGVLLFLVLVLLRKRAMRAILEKYPFCAKPWLRWYTDTLNKDDDAVVISFENNLAEDTTCNEREDTTSNNREDTACNKIEDE